MKCYYFDHSVPMEGDATQKDNCAVTVASLGAIHLKSRPRQDSTSLEDSSASTDSKHLGTFKRSTSALERISQSVKSMSKSSSAEEAFFKKMKHVAYDR